MLVPFGTMDPRVKQHTISLCCTGTCVAIHQLILISTIQNIASEECTSQEKQEILEAAKLYRKETARL